MTRYDGPSTSLYLYNRATAAAPLAPLFWRGECGHCWQVITGINELSSRCPHCGKPSNGPATSLGGSRFEPWAAMAGRFKAQLENAEARAAAGKAG
jgi:predicted amidophosphoribosyltransferase